ncbi:MAG: hypothetical protein ABFR75_11715 [Acidobacteriota bacterium]
MKRSFLIIFFIPILSLLLLSGVEKENKHIVYKETVADNILSVGKNIIIEGIVEKSVIKIGGTISIKGVVKKDVVCLNSKVDIIKDAKIGGDLIVIGGELIRPEKINVKGEVHYLNFSLNKIDTSLMSFMINPKSIDLLKTLLVIMSLIIALIVFGILPKKIIRASEILDENKLRTGALGLLSFISFILLFLIFIILSFVYIGIPFLFVLMLAVIIMFIFGRTVLYYHLGAKVVDIFNFPVYSPAFFILIGVIVYLVLNFIPFLGYVLLKILALLELGIAVGYLLQKKLKLKTMTDIISDYGNSDH